MTRQCLLRGRSFSTSIMKLSFLFLVFFAFASQSALAQWRWDNKVAVVTGASSGIGEEIAIQLADKGMVVAALARREHRLQELVQKSRGKIHPVVCDITNEQDILNAFRWIETNLGGVDVLVNNAGTYINTPLENGNTSDWRLMFDLNTMGLAICSREALKTMRTRGDNGQIINISSIAGLGILHVKNMFNGLYSGTKYAVRAMSEALSNELSDAGSKIKITTLSPGLVITELINNRTYTDIGFSKVIESTAHIDVQDIAESVVYILSTKPGVHIPEITLKHMGSVGGC